MPAVSPYQANDYQAVSNYRPYELPINDIFKAISAQNQFWDAGAAKVKSVYENALNLSLTTEENKNIRKQFMQDADKQLTKLSTMDLGDASVVRQGFNLYKPLFKNKEIMYDNQLTELQSSIFSEAQRYKKDEKTKGEGFHMDNLAYALMPFQGFGKDTRREDLEGIYNKAKNSEYIPFYDDSKERADILKSCEYDEYSKTSEQGMMLVTEKVKSRTSNMINACLQSQLSDKARQQTRISGAVRYKQDYNTLKTEYADAAQDGINFATKEIERLSAQKAAISGRKEPEYEEVRKNIDKQIDMNRERLSSYNYRLNGGDPAHPKEMGIANWDEKYIQDRYEDLAYQAYFNVKYGSFAEAYARTKIEEDSKANPIAMMYYVQGKEDSRLERTLKSRENIAQTDAMAKILGGGGDMISKMRALKGMGYTPDQIATFMGTAEVTETTNLDAVNSFLSERDGEINKIVSQIKDDIGAIKELVPNANAIVDEKTMIAQLPNLLTAIQGILDTDPTNAKALRLKDGLNQLLDRQNERLGYKSMLDDAKDKVEKSQGAVKVNFEKLREDFTKRNIRDATGKPYDTNFLFDVVAGYNPDYETITDGFGRIDIVQKSTGKHLSFDERDSGFGYADSDYIVRQLVRKLQKTENNYRSAINDYLGKNTVIQRTIIGSGNMAGTGKVSDKPENMTPLMGVIADIWGQTLGPNVVFSNIGGIDPKDGTISIQATGGTPAKPKIYSKRELEDAAANGQLGKGFMADASRQDRKDAIRIKLPPGLLESIGMAKPTGWDNINTLLVYAEQQVQNYRIPGGMSLSVGITPAGNSITLKTINGIGSNPPDHFVVFNNQEFKATSKEEAINMIRLAREGKVLDKPIIPE